MAGICGLARFGLLSKRAGPNGRPKHGPGTRNAKSDEIKFYVLSSQSVLGEPNGLLGWLAWLARRSQPAPKGGAIIYHWRRCFLKRISG